MDKASQKIWNLVNYYLNSNKQVIESFFREYLFIPLSDQHFQILTGNQLRKIITTDYTKNDLRKLTKQGNSITKTALFIWNHVIPKVKGQELAIFNMRPTKLDKGYYNNRPVRLKDVYWLKDDLLDFLENHIDIRSQISWVLKNKPISNHKLAKKVGMNPSQITKYRNGTLKVGNMSINNGKKLQEYYYLLVSNQLVGHDVPMTASDIENSFKDAENSKSYTPKQVEKMLKKDFK